MNRWATRHHGVIAEGLEPGETLLAAERVVMSAATVAGESRRGHRGRAKRVEAARGLGFPVPGPIFVVALTDQRVVLYSASTWLARPRVPVGSITLDSVAAIRVVRRLLAERLAVLREDRAMLVLQPLWGRGLRALDRAFAALRDADQH